MLAIIFWVASTGTFAQNNKCPNVPFWKTRNPQKLSVALTKNCKNDNEKVHAIHCWVTHHIKYDVKKFFAFDHEVLSVKKILKRRKAICTGYSDLFNELCKYAGVYSVGVPGYIKNIYVDLFDKFYLDEHIWNATFIDGQWKHIDACWDAGYIKYQKRTFIGFFVHAFTLGKYDVTNYKPHFIRRPVEDYYCKDGNYFSYDHLPADPLWQFLSTEKSIVDFERDSSYYLDRQNEEVLPYDDYLDSKRFEVAKMNQSEREIFDGLPTYNFNNRNQFHRGNSYSLSASKMLQTLMTDSVDSLTQLIQCDSISQKIKLAINCYDSTKYYLAVQDTELIFNNKLKNNIVKNQNHRLIKSTATIFSGLKGAKKIYKSSKAKIKSAQKSNDKRYFRFIASEAFYKTKFSPNSSQTDTARLFSEINLLKDSIDNLVSSIKAKIKFLDDLYPVHITNLGDYYSASGINRMTTLDIIEMRLGCIDDLDYPLRYSKDTLIKYKCHYDTLLIDTSGKFVVRSYYNGFSSLLSNLTVLHKTHLKIANDLTALKRIYSDSDFLSKLFTENEEKYVAEWRELFLPTLTAFQDRFHEMYILSSGIKRTAKKELKGYRQELETEGNMFPSRTQYIGRHYSSLIKLIDHQKSADLRMLQQFDRVKNGEKLNVVFRNFQSDK